MFWAAKKASTDGARIEELLSRCVAEAIPSKESLRKLLLSGKRLRVKLGIDPTSPNIHLGRTVPLLKLKDFQELGHTVIFIAGDFTALVGDTSDKDSERPMLSEEVITKNMKTYREQVGKILDLSQTEFHRNSEWLSKLSFKDVATQADIFSVSDFTARENVKRRLDEGKRVSLREVLYPLMQGYDSVAVRADVELGGSDQRFNILAGRPMQEHYGQAPQHALLFTLITSPDGRKMSSSWGNTVNITDAVSDMFGKVMAVPDEFVESYFMHVTRVPEEKVKMVMAGHPKDAKMVLAKEIVRMYHGDNAAKKAETQFTSTFSERRVPQDVQEIKSAGPLRETLVKNGVIASNSEFTRLALGKDAAVRLLSNEGEIKIRSADAPAQIGTVYRIGKHRFVKIVK